MILYYKGAFGLNLLFRLRGSAVYRGMIPGIISVLVFICIHLRYGEREPEDLISHPYAFGVLISSVSFLIVFRANHSYSRYWEACGSIHEMMSKWMDATTHIASYHMQCDHYIHIKPPSFYDYANLNGKFYTMDRKRTDGKMNGESNLRCEAALVNGSNRHSADDFVLKKKQPKYLCVEPRLDGGWRGLFSPKKGEKESSTFYNKNLPWNSDKKGFASTQGGRTPSLFLQELAHLCSLLNAVALSTLRNDVDGAESPLGMYQPGEPWPKPDPGINTCRECGWSMALKLLGGNDRSPEARTAFNAARPLSVIGGVSDAEIRFLQTAKGPYAKTQLCWQWLSEFMVREHLSGSTGQVGGPIISRVMQFLSDGMLGYNHARKIMYVPFPFPHAQISVFYIIFTIFVVPILMDEITSTMWLGVLLSFLTTTCLAGLHEVARELENPFRNVPNDLPVCTFQAFFNEALITMFAGYHPDSFWNTNISESVDKTRQFEGFKKAPTPKEVKNDFEELQTLVEAQGREIKRLRQVIEGQSKESPLITPVSSPER